MNDRERMRMQEIEMENVIELNNFKSIEALVRERFGNKFVIAFMEGNICHTFISDELSDMEICYIADTLNERRNE